MTSAAKRRNFFSAFIALALLFCASHVASANVLEISKPRAEFKTDSGETRISESLFYSVKHDRNYDRFGAIALESSVAPKGTAVAEEGGLNLFKWNQRTSTRASGWREGDRFLHLPNQGSARANWAQNSTRLRQEMRSGRPIFDSHVDDAGNLIPTQGFLNAERNLLINRGCSFNPSTGAWHPPLGN